MDAAYKSIDSKKWEAVELDDWRGSNDADVGVQLKDYDDDHFLVKEEVMPDGSTKLILKEKRADKVAKRKEKRSQD